jgi:hypothetical protein
LNALSLTQLVQRRNPSYDQSEYLSEVNAAYKECWDYILQLEDSFFTATKVVTVGAQAAEFDLINNQNGFLSGPVSIRLYQINRIRILATTAQSWAAAMPRSWNDDDYQAQQQANPQTAYSYGPYLYIPFSKGSILFAKPMPAGTQIEVTYNFEFMPLALVSNGSVASSGTAVTGTDTNFTQIVPIDFAGALPGNNQDTDIGLELVLNAGANNQTYRVTAVTNDTNLTLLNAASPAFSGVNYALASVPDIPDGQHNTIATIATRNFMSTPGNDPRFEAWAALAEKEMNSMRDSIMVRQKQEPPRVKPFPQGLLRYRVQPQS